jgi:glutamine synthetase
MGTSRFRASGVKLRSKKTSVANWKIAQLGALTVHQLNKAPGGSSDCLLKPVFIAKDPQRKNAYLVMCEVLSPGGAAHESNGRATIEDDDNDFWFGFEQEYFLWNPATNKPIGFPKEVFPGHKVPITVQ